MQKYCTEVLFLLVSCFSSDNHPLSLDITSLLMDMDLDYDIFPLFACCFTNFSHFIFESVNFLHTSKGVQWNTNPVSRHLGNREYYTSPPFLGDSQSLLAEPIKGSEEKLQFTKLHAKPCLSKCFPNVFDQGLASPSFPHLMHLNMPLLTIVWPIGGNAGLPNYSSY